VYNESCRSTSRRETAPLLRTQVTFVDVKDASKEGDYHKVPFIYWMSQILIVFLDYKTSPNEGGFLQQYKTSWTRKWYPSFGYMETIAVRHPLQR
jgi:hypothetical protein